MKRALIIETEDEELNNQIASQIDDILNKYVLKVDSFWFTQEM